MMILSIKYCQYSNDITNIIKVDTATIPIDYKFMISRANRLFQCAWTMEGMPETIFIIIVSLDTTLSTA